MLHRLQSQPIRRKDTKPTKRQKDTRSFCPIPPLLSCLVLSCLSWPCFALPSLALFLFLACLALILSCLLSCLALLLSCLLSGLVICCLVWSLNGVFCGCLVLSCLVLLSGGWLVLQLSCSCLAVCLVVCLVVVLLLFFLLLSILPCLVLSCSYLV
jgi:hypothetical protein